MSDSITSLYLTWDGNGRVKHRITGANLPPPRNDTELWIIAPSGFFFINNQLGVLRPSHGLILCSQAIDISLQRNYLLSPINTTLQAARLDYVYNSGGLNVRYFPKHSIIHNNDSLEEGTRQLVANNYYTVLNRITDYYQFNIKIFAGSCIANYFDFLESQISSGAIGPNLDRWNLDFSRWQVETVRHSSTKYFQPNPPESRKDDWRSSMEKALDEVFGKLIKRHKAICKIMRIL